MPISSNYMYNELPPWFAAQQQRLGEAAEGLRQAPYQHYPYERMAPYMNPDLEKSYELGREINDVQPYINEAGEMARQGANQEFTGDNVGKYMNPYQQQVIDNLVSNSGRAFKEEYLPAMRREFISSGNYGGTQHNQQAERLMAEHQRKLNEQIAQTLQEGYTHGGKMFESAAARKLEGSPKMGDVGLLKQASRVADIAALRDQGEDARKYEQSKRDINYQDFMRQQAFPYESLSHQASILTGMPQQPSQYSIQQTPGQPQLNTAGQLGALAGNIYGARMAYGRKSGGSITTPKKPKQKPKGLSRLSLMEGTFARKPKTGGSKGFKFAKNKDKLVGGKPR